MKENANEGDWERNHYCDVTKEKVIHISSSGYFLEEIIDFYLEF